MTETTTTSSTRPTFQKQYPLALIALGEHIATHQLPAPHSIDTYDRLHNGHLEKAIRLYLPGEHTHRAWLATVHVDAQADEPCGAGLGTRSEWSVRLPDTGIRVQLVGFRHQLQVVS